MCLCNDQRTLRRFSGHHYLVDDMWGSRYNILILLHIKSCLSEMYTTPARRCNLRWRRISWLRRIWGRYNFSHPIPRGSCTCAYRFLRCMFLRFGMGRGRTRRCLFRSCFPSILPRSRMCSLGECLCMFLRSGMGWGRIRLFHLCI